MTESLDIYSLNEWSAWEALVTSVPGWDVYWLPGYLAPFEQLGQGHARLAAYRTRDHVVAYAFFERDIPGASGFRDIITPYGYGGPLLSPDAPAEVAQAFRSLFGEYCRGSRIVSEFIRFHPVLSNASLWTGAVTTEFNRETFAMDLRHGVEILNGLDATARNKVRKSQKHDVAVTIVPAEEAISDFARLYNASMDYNAASGFYYFPEDFFRQTARQLGGRAHIALASWHDTVIAASMLLQGSRFLHYHFSGLDREYRNLGVHNRVLYEAALWAQAAGFSTFHLGGGVVVDDSLARFKKSMASHTYSFSVGRFIHDPNVYQELVQHRERQIGALQPGFFPAYRAPAPVLG